MGSLLVNVVSAIPSPIWERELPSGLRHSYLHTSDPTQADFHVIYGVRTPLTVPNSRHRTAFVASEPPDIRHYNLKVLARYGKVYAPSFGYLSSLPNYEPLSPVAPWWVGTSAGGKEHYSDFSLTVGLGRSDFENLAPPERDVLSIIVSSKARTPLQVQRLKLVDYLSQRMSNLEVWGEGRRFVEDKALVLRNSRYHLAIENSIHPGYWTEKLADPILLSNYVFYQGAPDVGASLDLGGICAIDSFDLEGTYRRVSDVMNRGAWASSADARASNLRCLLGEESFHRAIDKTLPAKPPSSPRSSVMAIPPHHPASPLKSLTDPIYLRVKKFFGT